MKSDDNDGQAIAGRVLIATIAANSGTAKSAFLKLMIGPPSRLFCHPQANACGMVFSTMLGRRLVGSVPDRTADLAAGVTAQTKFETYSAADSARRPQ